MMGDISWPWNVDGRKYGRIPMATVANRVMRHGNIFRYVKRFAVIRVEERCEQNAIVVVVGDKQVLRTEATPGTHEFILPE